MKACGYCGQENDDVASHCKGCGTSLIEDSSNFDSGRFKNLFRLILIALTIGGGFTGLTVTVRGIFQLENAQLLSYLIYCVVIALYFFTIVSGLLFVDNRKCVTH
jgi:hypothetical protein